MFLPRESPWTEEPGGLQSMWSQKVGYIWATKHSTAPDRGSGSFLRNPTAGAAAEPRTYSACSAWHITDPQIVLASQGWPDILPLAGNYSQDSLPVWSRLDKYRWASEGPALINRALSRAKSGSMVPNEPRTPAIPHPQVGPGTCPLKHHHEKP